ncbi:UNVERIFIED_CONTAM: peptide/nickel transport system substrate-binding protein [Acetivibrio alkalicellulosi]
MKKTIVIIILIIFSIFISSCELYIYEEEPDEENMPLNYILDDVIDRGPEEGGVLNLFSTQPDTLNPLLTKNAYVKDYSEFIFESLVEIDRRQKPVPLLARSWEVSDDGLQWTFYLRENVYWHDNIPFTSEDVEFTFNVILSSSVNSHYRINLKNISAFSVVDNMTFKVELNSPNSFTPELLSFPIIPKHYFYEEEILTTDRNNRPVGTGPYKFSEYEANKHIKLIKNENWWRGEGEGENEINLPYISQIVIKIFPRNMSIGDAFQSKEVDIIHMDRSAWIRYIGRSDIALKKYPSNKFEFIAFNLSNSILQESEIRNAIAYTVDRDKLINNIMPGEAIASEMPVIPDTWIYDTNIISKEVNINKARELILESGWEENNQGVLHKKIGWANKPLKLELLVNNDNSTRIKVAHEIKNQLKEIGIEIEIDEVTWDEMNQRISSGKFDMVLIGCTITSVADISFMYSSKEIGGFNIAGYEREGVDMYLDLILKENNFSRKKSYFINMRRLINQDVPYLGLYFYNDAALFNRKIRGELNPSIWNKYEDYSKWYIPFN